ncbi:MAG: type II toxin-antitoxin system RelE/ParE family toxin [Bacteriovoracaceae bacterium]
MIKTKVVTSRFAEKQIRKLPKAIREALNYWVEAVEFQGILQIRKYKGYHDEPLKGKRINQRSVRLNKSYRVIYSEHNDHLEILIIEVNNHEY